MERWAERITALSVLALAFFLSAALLLTLALVFALAPILGTALALLVVGLTHLALALICVGAVLIARSRHKTRLGTIATPTLAGSIIAELVVAFIAGVGQGISARRKRGEGD